MASTHEAVANASVGEGVAGDLRAVGAEQLGEGFVLRDQRFVERHEPALLRGVRIGAGPQEQLARSDVAERGRVEHVHRRTGRDQRLRRAAVATVERLPELRDLCFHGVRSNIDGMVGVVLVLLALFVAGPIGLFVVGALWSAAFGWLAVDDAEQHAGEAGAQASAS